MNMRIVIVLVATVGTGVLRADYVTYTVTPNSGQFLYQLTLGNTGATGGTLFDLFLSPPTDISNTDTATIGEPVGWGDSTGGLLFFGPDATPGTSFIEWAADFSGSYDAGIGSSLSGFSHNSSVNIGQPIRFALNGSTSFSTAQEISSVPEPSSGTLFSVSLVLLGFHIWKRFRVRDRSPVSCANI